MKKMISTALLTLSLLTASLAPATSHAVLIVSSITSDIGYDDIGEPAIYLCWLVLPLCILGEKAGGASSATVADLKANAYSDKEIALILRDQKNLSESLAAKNMALKVKKTDTAGSVAHEIRSVYPQVSPLFLNYITDSLSLK